MRGRILSDSLIRQSVIKIPIWLSLITPQDVRKPLLGSWHLQIVSLPHVPYRSLTSLSHKLCSSVENTCPEEMTNNVTWEFMPLRVMGEMCVNVSWHQCVSARGIVTLPTVFTSAARSCWVLAGCQVCHVYLVNPHNLSCKVDRVTSVYIWARGPRSSLVSSLRRSEPLSL